MQAIIVEERSKDLEEVKKVEPFLPIFQKHAEFLGLPMEIDIPHRKPLDPINDGKFHIHIFSDKKVSQNERTLKSVFGFGLPEKKITYPLPSYGWEAAEVEEEALEEEDVGSDHDVASVIMVIKEGEDLFSPEGDVICKIYPRNIFILFDFFHQQWKGQDLVLNQILEEGMPRAILLENPNSLALNKIVRNYQKKFLFWASSTFSKQRHQIREEFIRLGTFFSAQNLAKVNQDLEKKRAEHEKVTQTLNQKYLETESVSRQIDELKTSAADTLEECAQQFDLILKTEHVRGIRVKEIEEKKTIIVYTDRIFQRVWGEEYDIGEFEIWIRPGESAFLSTPYPPGIQFKPGNYPGTHKHPEAEKEMGHVCFGQANDFGFNPDVNKLYQDCDFASIVNYSLFLLEMDTHRKPTERKQVFEYSPPTQPFYSSEEEKIEERKAFAELVKHFKEKNLRESLEEALPKSRDLLAKEAAKFEEIRTSLKELLFLRNHLEKEITQAISRLGEDLDWLSKQKDIVQIEVFEDLLQVLIRINSKKRLPILARFWIYPASGEIWLRSFDPGLQITFPREQESETAIYNIVLQSMSRGKLAQSILLLRDYFLF